MKQCGRKEFLQVDQMVQINPGHQEGGRQKGRTTHLSTESFFKFSLMSVYGFSVEGERHPTPASLRC